MRSHIRIPPCQMDVVSDAILNKKHNEGAIEKSDSSSFGFRFPVFHQGPLELFQKWSLENNVVMKYLKCASKIDDVISEHRNYAQGKEVSLFDKVLAEQQATLDPAAALQLVHFNEIMKCVIKGFCNTNHLKHVKQNAMKSKKPRTVSQHDCFDTICMLHRCLNLLHHCFPSVMQLT